MTIDDFFAQAMAPTRPSASMGKQPWQYDAAAQSLPRLRAFIDETGDRGDGTSGGSPIFGMASVIATEAAETQARAVLRQLRVDFGTPAGRPLSWKQDLKTHDRRVHAAELLGAVPGLTVIYVVTQKDALDPGTYGADITLLYNVVAYATLQRTLWAAARYPLGQHQIEVRFGHVAKHDPTDTQNYFILKRDRDSRVPFWLMSHLGWVGAHQYEMSQVADLYAGFLKAGTWPNGWGRVEGSYIRSVWHHIRTVNGCPVNLGFQYRPRDALARALPWWPCACGRCRP